MGNILTSVNMYYVCDGSVRYLLFGARDIVNCLEVYYSCYTKTRVSMIPISETFRSQYKLLSPLGQGGYGSVWLSERRVDQTKFAVKIIPDINCSRKTWCCVRNMYIPEEVMVWEDLSHPNNSSFVNAFYEHGKSTQAKWMLVMEYSPEFVDLFDYIDRHGTMSSEDAAHIIKKVIEVCYYLATENVDHRDIKDENILYNPKTKEIKLIDFGSASILSDCPYKTLQGTGVYIPPEFYRSGSYHAFPAAVWSIGCLSYVLLDGFCPFNTQQEVLEYKTLSSTNLNIDSVSRDFITACLTIDPNCRISFQNLIYHNWFNRQ